MDALPPALSLVEAVVLFRVSRVRVTHSIISALLSYSLAASSIACRMFCARNDFLTYTYKDKHVYQNTHISTSPSKI